MRGLLMALLMIEPALRPGERPRVAASTKTTAKKTTGTTV